MADTDELQPDENTSEEETPSGNEIPAESKETENWEQRYKDLQAESTRTSQEAAELRRKVETYEQAPPEEPEEEENEGEYVDRKTVKQMVSSAVSDAVRGVRMQSAATHFRTTYPELVKYESAIAGIMRTPKDPAKLKGASPEERIDAAVKEFNAMTEETKATATAEAEAAAKEREETNRKAAGLGGSGTPPPKDDEEGVSDEQEIANRKTQSAKRRGLA